MACRKQLCSCHWHFKITAAVRPQRIARAGDASSSQFSSGLVCTSVGDWRENSLQRLERVLQASKTLPPCHRSVQQLQHSRDSFKLPCNTVSASRYAHSDANSARCRTSPKPCALEGAKGRNDLDKTRRTRDNSGHAMPSACGSIAGTPLRCLLCVVLLHLSRGASVRRTGAHAGQAPERIGMHANVPTMSAGGVAAFVHAPLPSLTLTACTRMTRRGACCTATRCRGRTNRMARRHLHAVRKG